ncbi:hypothetical protein [Oligoflexus tunisiensis]|uniref:hypothetical protein n=1 Tax=Oligoflexus tunisiensis TaxID=708132 RepID=UPI001C406240|nr:hypothetical protein [Oligoflexus tunisiensis]
MIIQVLIIHESAFVLRATPLEIGLIDIFIEIFQNGIGFLASIIIVVIDAIIVVKTSPGWLRIEIHGIFAVNRRLARRTQAQLR